MDALIACSNSSALYVLCTTRRELWVVFELRTLKNINKGTTIKR